MNRIILLISVNPVILSNSDRWQHELHQFLLSASPICPVQSSISSDKRGLLRAGKRASTNASM
jgi:hypothetical protein